MLWLPASGATEKDLQSRCRRRQRRGFDYSFVSSASEGDPEEKSGRRAMALGVELRYKGEERSAASLFVLL
ncbi:unnamed protein product [Linum trigynum]|uniref:Uncharacterized protein n=1 Tax=Linum trigynum TaxID=586398 RepID=A0AAV2E2C2_9ROSI